jgi:hypothetical protein
VTISELIHCMTRIDFVKAKEHASSKAVRRVCGLCDQSQTRKNVAACARTFDRNRGAIDRTGVLRFCRRRALVRSSVLGKCRYAIEKE